MHVHYEFPKAFDKFIKEFRAGNITPDMVEISPSIHSEPQFTTHLQAYDAYGEPIGKVHTVVMCISAIEQGLADYEKDSDSVSKDLVIIKKKKTVLVEILKEIERLKKLKKKPRA